LTVYKSSKNATSQQEENYVDKESIGENGVGLKQGSATLSNCSIVLTEMIHSILSPWAPLLHPAELQPCGLLQNPTSNIAGIKRMKSQLLPMTKLWKNLL